MMKNHMEIPHSPEGLSSIWLTRALQYGHVIGTGAVSEFECSPLETGKGFYGQIVRLKLAYNPPDLDAPQTMIAKFSSGNPDMRQRPNTRASYKREVRFYQELAKENILPVPTCYYADVDNESGWHILLLEDLSPACSGSRTRGCSGTEARIAVHHIGRFHAYWWENKRLDDYMWLAGTEIPGDDELAHFREQLLPAFLQKLGKPLPDEMMDIGELLGEYKGRIAQHLFSKRPQTLIHADYHLDNLMFGETGERAFFVVDWQFVKRGRGIWDVAYFLSQNLLSEDRQAVEMNLLSDYLKILENYGVHNYSLDDAMNDYRLSLLHRFGNLITTIAAMPFTEEQIKMHVDVLLSRIISAVLDHDCRSLLNNGSMMY
ncbi:phosphotransferase [Chloroflexota bacterium]